MQKKASSDRPLIDMPQLARYIGGGALVGGGLAGIYSMLKDINRMNAEAAGPHSSEDDDVIYIKSKKKEDTEEEKVASADKVETWNDDSLNTFLKGLGAVAGAAGGFYGIRELYDSIRKKSLQEEMDRSQIAYIEALNDKRDKERKKYASFDKEAGTQRSLMSQVGSGGLSIMFLLALASGIITNKALNKAYPRMKPQKPRQAPGGRPISRAPVSEDKPDPHFPTTVKINEGEDEEVVKTTDKNSPAEEIENLIRTTTADEEVSKSASFDDLLAALALGRASEVKEATREYGIDHAFSIVKGASLEKVSNIRKELAIGLLANDPLLKEAFVPVVAGEYYNMSPYLCKAANTLPEAIQDALCKLAATFNETYRAEVFKDSKLKDKVAGALASGISSGLTLNNDLEAILDSDEEELNEGSSFQLSGEDSDEGDEENSDIGEGTDGGEVVEEGLSGKEDSIDQVFEDTTIDPDRLPKK